MEYTHHTHHHGMDHRVINPGATNWMPWVGLALVLPAVLVLLVGTMGVLSSSGPSGSRGVVSAGSGIMGLGGGLFVALCAFGGLMLGSIGLVRALRRGTPRDGTSQALAGGILDAGVIVLAAAALVALVLFGL